MPAEIVDETGLAAACAPRAETREESSQEALPSPGANPSLVRVAEMVIDVLLEAVGRARSEVVVVLVGDERIRVLNLLWRSKDQPTDVLSFSQLEGEDIGGEADLLGDIVVSVDTLRRQARDGNWSDEEELARLLLHGLLHLLGYDHEQPVDELAMKVQEGRLARTLLERGFGCAWEEDSAS